MYGQKIWIILYCWTIMTVGAFVILIHPHIGIAIHNVCELVRGLAVISPTAEDVINVGLHGQLADFLLLRICRTLEFQRSRMVEPNPPMLPVVDLPGDHQSTGFTSPVSPASHRSHSGS